VRYSNLIKRDKKLVQTIFFHICMDTRTGTQVLCCLVQASNSTFDNTALEAFLVNHISICKSSSQLWHCFYANLDAISIVTKT